MIGFASIFQLEGAWRADLDSALTEMLDALEGAERSIVETIELRSNTGRSGKIGFITNRTRPMLKESEQAVWIIYGQIFNDDARISDRLDRWAAQNGSPKDQVLELNGAFTFFHFDKRSGALNVFRDRGGVKPVFYHQSSSELLLASGLRGIAKCSRFVNRTIER